MKNTIENRTCIFVPKELRARLEKIAEKEKRTVPKELEVMVEEKEKQLGIKK